MLIPELRYNSRKRPRLVAVTNTFALIFLFSTIFEYQVLRHYNLLSTFNFHFHHKEKLHYNYISLTHQAYAAIFAAIVLAPASDVVAVSQ